MSKCKIVSYYLLIFIGLIIISWIIWARFLRERLPRDIPDFLFTEYRFFILLYLCAIYIYIIKNLIKPKKHNPLFSFLSELLFTPLITLDHLIKYNSFTKPYYEKLVSFILDYFNNFIEKKLYVIFMLFDIIPRTILMFVLLFDTFHVFQISLFYKIVLIGLFPFLLRYFIYCMQDIPKHWIETLEEKYDNVLVFEKGYEYDLSRKHETEAIYHHKFLSIKEYIEVKYNNMVDNKNNYDFPYEYVGEVYPKDEIYLEYKKNTYQDINANLTEKDYEIIKKSFKEKIQKIFDVKQFNLKIDAIKQHTMIKWPKIEIFSSYLLCWGFILLISYYYYPVQFDLFHNYCKNVCMCLLRIDDPFLMVCTDSLEKNNAISESLEYIIKNISRV